MAELAAVLAERVLALRRLIDRLNGGWLKELAAMDIRDEVVE